MIVCINTGEHLAEFRELVGHHFLKEDLNSHLASALMSNRTLILSTVIKVSWHASLMGIYMIE